MIKYAVDKNNDGETTNERKAVYSNTSDKSGRENVSNNSTKVN